MFFFAIERWNPLTVIELKAFLAIHIYMGLQKQPNITSYWNKEGSIFCCPMISNVMTMHRFKLLQRCMHLTNPAPFATILRSDPGYDKMRQVQWLVNDIQDAYKREWRLGKHVIVDEMMVRYKGKWQSCGIFFLCCRN